MKVGCLGSQGDQLMPEVLHGEFCTLIRKDAKIDQKSQISGAGHNEEKSVAFYSSVFHSVVLIETISMYILVG